MPCIRETAASASRRPDSAFREEKMGECSFCTHTGKLSAEHIASDWMNVLFPGRRKAWLVKGDPRERKEFETDSLDWTAKVVCESCNNGWMSEIEAHHAKPALTPLITGEMEIPIDLNRAQSMALFAFKTAVVLDHSQRDRVPFFSKRQRCRIQSIPPPDTLLFRQ